jgi:3-oxoacyl-[acyl-carrier-protein] synthase III
VSPASVGLGSFACVLGDEKAEPTSVPGFEEAWAAASSGAAFDSMGVSTFRRMSGPFGPYLVEAVRTTLADAGTDPADVDHIVFATTDAGLGRAGPDLVRDTLGVLGLVRALPVMISYQQCCSSLGALRYAHDLFADPGVGTVVLVSFDLVLDDTDRMRPFAFMSDSVASCVLRRGAGELVLRAAAVGVDHSGLTFDDSFASRQRVARDTLGSVFERSGAGHEDVVKVFPTNLYLPLAVFNASVAGIHKNKLHFVDSLRDNAHCGNSDWMVNLMDYRTTVGWRSGERFLAQASAPGFYACGLLEVA